MKAIFVNGSPRKNWNTHKMLASAMQGAQDAGAECELVHLYDLSFKGCMSCFACKLKNNKTNGVNPDGTRPRAIDKTIYSGIIYTMSWENVSLSRLKRNPDHLDKCPDSL